MKIRTVAQSLSDKLDSCNSFSIEGSGTDSDKYRICTPAQLATLANSADVFELGRDIDLSAEERFVPIASFKGKLYGNGHSIIGHHYSDPNINSVGLFDQVTSGVEFHDLVLDSSRIEGRNYVGALVGMIYDSGGEIILDNISVVNPVVIGKFRVGSIAGRADHTTLTNAKVKQTRITGDYGVGGLVGESNSDLLVTDAQVDGVINAGMYAGGAVGYLVSAIEVSRLGVRADITIDPDTKQSVGIGVDLGSVGGIFGYIKGTVVTDAFYVGSIVNTASYFKAIGGFAGSTDSSQVVTSYVSANNMTDVSAAGDAFGAFNGEEVNNIFDYSYYFQHANVPSESNGDLTGLVSTTELADSSKYYGFDFTSRWQMTTSPFTSPSLIGQSKSDPFGGASYRQNSRGGIYLTETEDATGYLFPDTQSDQFNYTYLTLTNNSGSTIYLKKAFTALENSFLPATGAFAGTCPVYLSASAPLYSGQTCTFGIRFNPDISRDAAVYDSFIVEYAISSVNNAVNFLSHKLDGYGVAMGPYFADSSYGFGNGVTGITSSPSTQSFMNTGAGDAEIISYTLSDTTHFGLDDSHCPVGSAIASGNSCDVDLTFTPSAVQAYTATLKVVYEDVATQKRYTMVLTLDGTGMTNPFPGDNSPSCLSRNGSLASPFCVYTKADLEKIRDNYGAYSTYAFEQIADIDMLETGDVSVTSCGINDFGGILFYSGDYNGGDFMISNLCSTSGYGFIGTLNGSARVHHLKFSNLQVTGPGTLAAIDGMMTLIGGVAAVAVGNAGIDHVTILSGKIDGSHIDVSGGHPQGHVTGGIVGGLAHSTYLNNSRASMTVIGVQRIGVGFGYARDSAVVDTVSTSGTVTATSTMAGGLGGLANGGTTVSNSSSSASITSGPVFFGYGSGGLLGATVGTLYNSYSTGSVSGVGHVGGLVGFSWGATVSNCFTTASVSATGGSVGGFVGWVAGGIITNSFAKGTVSANAGDYIGGFAGYVQGSTTLTTSYSILNAYSATSATHLSAFMAGDDASTTLMNNYYAGAAAAAGSGGATEITNGAGDYVDDITRYSGFDTGTPIWRSMSASPSGNAQLAPALNWMCGQNLGGTLYNCQ